MSVQSPRCHGHPALPCSRPWSQQGQPLVQPWGGPGCRGQRLRLPRVASSSSRAHSWHQQERHRSISKKMPVTRGGSRLGCRQGLGACRGSLSPCCDPRRHIHSSWAQGRSPLPPAAPACLPSSRSHGHVGRAQGGRERAATTAPSPPRDLSAADMAHGTMARLPQASLPGQAWEKSWGRCGPG